KPLQSFKSDISTIAVNDEEATPTSLAISLDLPEDLNDSSSTTLSQDHQQQPLQVTPPLPNIPPPPTEHRRVNGGFRATFSLCSVTCQSDSIHHYLYVYSLFLICCNS
ncbi:hypothetical protein OSTOST_09870, partial [Ostertagia ostertagi]